MLHRFLILWAAQYADGSLRWPLRAIVERHSRKCPECRRVIQADMALWQQIDNALFSPTEIVHTAAMLTREDAVRRSVRPFIVRRLVPALAAAAVVVLMAVVNLQLPVGIYPQSGNAIYASSSSGDSFVVIDDLEASVIGGSVFTSDAHGEG